MLHMAMYLNYIVLSQQYYAIWVIFVTTWTLGLHFICTKKSPSPWKNTTFVFNRKIRHFPDLRVTQDFLCIEPEVLPTTYKKISIPQATSIRTRQQFGHPSDIELLCMGCQKDIYPVFTDIGNYLPISENELPISVNKFPISVNKLPISVNHLPISVNHLPISVNHLPISVNGLGIYGYR